MSMKIGRILMVAGVLSAVALQALAQEEQYAYSANAVGVIRRTLPAGKMMLVSVPRDDTSSTNAAIPFLELPFIASLPNKSTASIWDVANSRWISGTKSRGSWTGLITSQLLQPGQCIFIQNGGAADMPFTMVGEVPSDSSIPIALGSANQLQGCANPYPVAFEFGTSALASNAVNKSTVNFWKVDEGCWLSGTKSRGKWDAKVVTNSIAPGEGFMIQYGDTAVAGQTWEVTKPYEWPETVN